MYSSRWRALSGSGRQRCNRLAGEFERLFKVSDNAAVNEYINRVGSDQFVNSQFLILIRGDLDKSEVPSDENQELKINELVRCLSLC